MSETPRSNFKKNKEKEETLVVILSCLFKPKLRDKKELSRICIVMNKKSE